MVTNKNSWLYIGLVMVLMYMGACTLDEDNSHSAQRNKNTMTSHFAFDAQNDPVYKLLLAEAYYYADDEPQAADHYFDILKNIQTEDSYIAERAVALAIQAKKYDQALQAALLWQRFDANATSLNQYLLLLYQEKGQLKEAAKILNELIQQLSKTSASALDLSVAFLGQSIDKEQTYGVLKLYTATYNKTPKARYYEALLAHQTGHYEEALQVVKTILAQVKESQTKQKQANDTNTILAEENKEILQKALLLKVGILMKQNKEEQAVVILNELIHQAAGVQTKQNYARLMASLGKPSEAVELLQQVYAEQPDNVALLRDIIAIHFSNENYKATLPLIDDLETKEDQEFVALYFRGMAFEALEQYGDALASYQAIDASEYENITTAELQRRIVIVLERHKGLKAALKHVQKQQKEAKKQNDMPLLAAFYVLESDLYRTAEQYKKALAMNEKAVKLLPKNSKILYAQALLYEALKDIASAEKILRSILEFDEENSDALNALGYLLADQTTRYDEALVYIKDAYRLQPNDPMIIDSLGWVYFKMGDMQNAEKYLRQAYEKRADIEIAAHLIELLAKKGAREEAKILLQDMLEKNPGDKILLRVKTKQKL